MTPLPDCARAKAYPPKSLADIVGHYPTVQRLRGRFQRGRHDLPLLLYGPSGVGKMTVARMYAKALLCETPRDDCSLPCEECGSCRVFDEPGSRNLDFYPMDAAQHHNARELLGHLNVHPHGPRRVIIIDNFDKAPPQLADALLKSMEEEQSSKTPRSIVVLAKDLNDVRKAGQSRCEVERLAPLLSDEARDLCARAIAKYDIVFEDEGAIDALVIGCRGLPELVAMACSAMHGMGRVTPQRVRQVLKVDWGESVLRFWVSLLSDDQSAKLPPLERGSEHYGAAIFSRYVLSELLSVLRTGRIGRAHEPALQLVDEELFRRVLGAVEERARRDQLSPEALLTALGEAFLEDDFDDDLGGIEFERVIQGVLRGHSSWLSEGGL